MTRAEVIAAFRSYVLPHVRAHYEADGVPDWPARSQAWACYTDSLCKAGSITLRQYELWTQPRICRRRGER